MEIAYTSVGELITPAQANIIDNYSKFFLNNGTVKKIEFYRGRNIWRVDYYKDPGETEEAARQLMLPYGVISFIIQREAHGKFTLTYENGYDQEGNLDCKGQSVYTPDARMPVEGLHPICLQTIDMNTGEPIHDLSLKFLGWQVEEWDTDYCQFHYNDAGILTFGEYNHSHDYDSEGLHAGNMEWLKVRFQLTDAMYNYYLTDEFLPPLD
jgi:hypothetical protein